MSENNKKNTIYLSNELNEDINQNNQSKDIKQKLIEHTEKNKLNNNSYNSINDSIDYLGCINGNCSKIHCDCGNNNCECCQGNCNEKHEKHDNNQFSNLHYLIDVIFLILIVILFVCTVFNKKSENLIYIIILILFYIFYKMYTKNLKI